MPEALLIETEKSLSGLMRIDLQRFDLECAVGVLPEERLARQRLRFDCVLYCQDPGACLDNLEHTFNYAVVIDTLRKLAEGPHVELLESFAEKLALAVFAYPAVECLVVSVTKLDLLPGEATVGITRTFNREAVARLGSRA